MKSARNALVFFSITVAFLVVCVLRDRGTGGPHHDEVICLMASKAGEADYAKMLDADDAPMHQIVRAAEWHRYTKGFERMSFTDIRDDVMSGDKHPPSPFGFSTNGLAFSAMATTITRSS